MGFRGSRVQIPPSRLSDSKILTYGGLVGGGMSQVFRAHDDALPRKVVVKVLRADLVEGLSAERFKREIDVAARQHLHIIPLLAAAVLREGAVYCTGPASMRSASLHTEMLAGRPSFEGRTIKCPLTSLSSIG